MFGGLRRSWRSILPLAAVLGAACEVRGPSPMLYAGALVAVHAENENQADVDLYALRGTTQHRIAHLGVFEVMDIDVGSMFLPNGELVLLVRSLGSDDTWTSPVITTHGRTRIDLRITPEMSQTGYRVTYLDEDDGGRNDYTRQP